MKPYLLLMALIFGFQLTMKAQKSKPNQAQPKEDIHVNREFDQNGNLVKFDSIYSYSWSGDTLLTDSLHPGNFAFPFGNNFNFPPDSSFFDLPFFQGFDPNTFGLFSQKQDSLMKKFRSQHHLQFKNDSISSDSLNINDFFNQFSDNKNDSASINSPFKNKFDFSPNAMNKMMEMMEKQMMEMEEQHQKYFSK